MSRRLLFRLSVFLTGTLGLSCFSGYDATAADIPASLSSSGSSSSRASPARFHVDPAHGSDSAAGTSPTAAFKSLDRARDAVRALPRPLTADVEIILADGNYLLTKPFALTAADSGENGHFIRYSAAPGATPRLDGGLRITGWVLHDAAKGIYRATLPHPIESRQLFVNGHRALRARSIGGLDDLKRENFGYTLPAGSSLGTWKNPSDLEFVYRHIWTNPRAGVASINRLPEAVCVTMGEPGFGNGRNKGMTSIDLPWYLENAYELLDEPREWYLDRTGAVLGAPYTLFYKPADWEDLARSEVVLPVLEQLVTVDGSGIAAPARDVHFQGITFRYTTWLRPSSPFGLPDAQNNVMRENFAKFGKASGDQESIIHGAALRLSYATGIRITGSRFLHLGGIGVCFTTAGAQDNLIEGNTFFDIAANAIQIGDYVGWETPGTENDAFPADPRLHVARNKILNNYVNRAAVEYRSAIPIAISFPRDSVIAHNEIYNSPYSALHFGWSWDRIPKTAMGNNLIEYNRLQNALVELADGGLLYTLGASDPDHPATIVRNNWARQTRWGQGFYFDESSSHYEVYDNVIEEIGDANIKFNGKTNRETRVGGLYSNKDRNIISPGLDLTAAALSIEKVRPLNDPAHVAEIARIRAGAGLQPAFAFARQLPLDAVTYELEEGELSGGPFATNGMDARPAASGYSGMGYLTGLQNRLGASATVTARLSKSGPHELRLRYSSTGENVKGLEFVINSVVYRLPALPGGSDASTWQNFTQKVFLQSGDNTITVVTAEKQNAPLWLDRLDLVPIK
jgi:hypothetical protein